jgi:CubicO group peptidase (beta-lactamase class C family)
VKFVLASALSLAAVGWAQSPWQVDINRLNPADPLSDKNSYMHQPQSFYYFHHMDELGFRTDWVRRGSSVYPLSGTGGDLAVKYTFHGKQYSLADYLQRNFVTGILVLHDDQIVFEKYFHGADENSRFVSMSVSKSIVSILVGAAVADGKIRNIDDPVDKYLPYLSTSGYRDVTIREVLEMATGVDYNEDYADANSAAHKLGLASVSGNPSFQQYVATMKPTNTKPGTQFQYQSVNTQVLGLLVEQVTGESLNQYTEDKLWKKVGTQSDAFFHRGKKQANICAFACFNATVRDYARVGLMMMRGGELGGNRVVPASWVHESTTPGAEFLKHTDEPGFGYAYQWWIPGGNDGAFEALGIFGQSIYVNPAKHIVIVQTSAWPDAWPPALAEENAVAHEAIVRAVAR